MNATFTRNFTKSEEKAPAQIRQAFRERLALFLSDPRHPHLHNHPLHGRWHGYYSINISGDWRALYRKIANGEIELVEFENIGTHSQLYG